MAEDLIRERCDACHAGSPRVTDDEIVSLSRRIPSWTLRNEDGVPKLEREFPFRSYVEALDFTQRVGLAAEVEDHHPVLITEARSVRVIWWTHAIHGLHRNDFIMAAKTDAIYTGGTS